MAFGGCWRVIAPRAFERIDSDVFSAIRPRFFDEFFTCLLDSFFVFGFYTGKKTASGNHTVSLFLSRWEKTARPEPNPGTRCSSTRTLEESPCAGQDAPCGVREEPGRTPPACPAQLHRIAPRSPLWQVQGDQVHVRSSWRT